MIVFGINKVLNWCQVITHTGTYTCPIKEIDGALFFLFKKVWHPVVDFARDNAQVLINNGGKIVSIPFKK